MRLAAYGAARCPCTSCPPIHELAEHYQRADTGP